MPIWIIFSTGDQRCAGRKMRKKLPGIGFGTSVMRDLEDVCLKNVFPCISE
jgi:hypothetical protein